MIKRVLLDLDGVLAKMVEEALRVNRRHHLLADWPKGEYDMAKVCGLSVEEFWEAVDFHGFSFWADLPIYEWAGELIDMVSAFEWWICTAPRPRTFCVSGKLAWIMRKLGSKTKFVFTHDKHLMANKETLLIDDSEENVAKFVLNHGHAVVFPQPWNLGDESRRLEVVQKALEV